MQHLDNLPKAFINFTSKLTLTLHCNFSC